MAKKKSSTSPTSRTNALLRKRGATYGGVEKFVRFPKPHRLDFLGCIDTIATMEVDGYPRIVGIQSTGGDGNGVKRQRKSEAEPRLKAWLGAGGLFEVWWWRGIKVGKRTRWLVRVHRAEMTEGVIKWREIEY
jgi:hypothetical protein